MKSIRTKQYTVRNLSDGLDQVLRRKTRETGKSLNDVVLEALKKGVGLSEEPILYHDLDPLIRSWKEDSAFDQALTLQDQIDPALWS